jgi:hypothetical protein
MTHGAITRAAFTNQAARTSCALGRRLHVHRRPLRLPCRPPGRLHRLQEHFHESALLRNSDQLRRRERYRQNASPEGVKIGRRPGVKCGRRLTRLSSPKTALSQSRSTLTRPFEQIFAFCKSGVNPDATSGRAERSERLQPTPNASFRSPPGRDRTDCWRILGKSHVSHER